MKGNFVTDSIKYVGVDDKDLYLFESQYEIPDGVSYNSYVILDDKIAVMDGVDERGQDEWLDNVKKVLNDRKPDYFVIQHFEPDHSGSVEAFLKEYPDVEIVGNAKTFSLGANYADLSGHKQLVVKEGDELKLGSHTLKFIMAPMVHWPEVMVTYE
jgi:flavorubredoxin